MRPERNLFKIEGVTKIFVRFTHPLDGGDDGDWAWDDDGHRHEEAEGKEEAVVAAVLGTGPGWRAAADILDIVDIHS